MSIGLIGRKIGMTRIFIENASIPVSVVAFEPNRVSQIKTQDTDGYNAIQLTGGKKKASHVNKALTGHFAKAEVNAGDMIAEFRTDNLENFTLGQVIQIADVFKAEQYVDVRGTSKGKGFAGTVKRYNFRTQDMTHGNSRSHRSLGSTGQNQTPGKVFKGKKMAGHMGNVRCTTQNLQIIRIDTERNLLLIKGAIPGHPGARVHVTAAVKKKLGDE
jgi:large subunit ribosomal protein L3